MIARRALLLAAAAVFAPRGPAPARDMFSFTVLCNGRPIGGHTVVVERNPDGVVATTTIRLDAKFGFIPLYRYRHKSVETWRGDALVGLNARTDDNGTAFIVTAKAGERGLKVQGPAGTFIAPSDTVPTSYWSSRLVADRPLLDIQHGALLDVDRVRIARNRWALKGDLRLEISYDQNGRWSGLSFTLNGNSCKYRQRASSASAGALSP